MALKAFMAVLALAAIAVGLLLPVPHAGKAEAKSQIATVELGAG